MISPFRIGLVSAAILMSGSLPAAQAAETLLVTESTYITACGNLFKIDSNAAGMTAGERALKVQRNLDNALIAAKDRSPESVRVQIVNRNPVVTLDHYIIVTADGNSAARSGLTSMQLAQKWADSIRFCLADSAAISKYLAMLTGKYPLATIPVTGQLAGDEVVVAPSASLFPISLITPISTDTSAIGDHIEAVISHDVPLRTSYASYLPAGTIVSGEIAAANLPNHYLGKNAFTINFYSMTTPDGKKIPIDAHVYGGANTWRQINIKPLFAECCKPGTTIKDSTFVTIHVNVAKGHIVGAWKGANVDESLNPDNRLPKLVFKRTFNPTLVPAGEEMMLQLSATTVIAVTGRTM